MENQAQGVAPRKDSEPVRDFISMAVHDLREPLRAIRLGAHLLTREGRDNSEADAALGTRYLLDGAERMEILIRDLAEYCYEQVREPDFRDTDLECALLETKNELASELKSSGATITQDPLPTVPGNSASLAAVFRCLIGNACKFHSEIPPAIHVSAVRQGDTWLLSVEDNGVGFDPAYSDRIFRPFERLNGKRYPGSGLGLTLARRIIEQHGGRIWAESKSGGGALFRFTLPG